MEDGCVVRTEGTYRSIGSSFVNRFKGVIDIKFALADVGMNGIMALFRLNSMVRGMDLPLFVGISSVFLLRSWVTNCL